MLHRTPDGLVSGGIPTVNPSQQANNPSPQIPQWGQSLSARVGNLESGVKKINEWGQRLNGRVGALEQKFGNMEQRFGTLEQNIEQKFENIN